MIIIKYIIVLIIIIIILINIIILYYIINYIYFYFNINININKLILKINYIINIIEIVTFFLHPYKKRYPVRFLSHFLFLNKFSYIDLLELFFISLF